MTVLPTPPDSPHPSGQSARPEVTPAYALKELVDRLQREQIKIQDLLSSLGFALRSLNNLNQFLELIPLIASRVTDATGGALILFRQDGKIRLEKLHCQSDHNCQSVRNALEAATRQVTTAFPPSRSAMEIARTAMVSLDRHVHRYLGVDFQVFGTAIIVKNVERGRLYVFSQEPDYAWTEMRQKLVRLVADQTAVAIENEELTVALRKKERLGRELEIGAEIQLQLLPRRFPKIDGIDLAARCRTANQVGGDYYDFIPTTYDQIRYPESRQSALSPWSFAIGDVMGKGVPAGLIMTMIRGMLRAEVLHSFSGAQILHHLNHIMHTDLENSSRFVTLFYGEYNPKARTLSYSNAAHNPPLLWRAATNTVTRLDTVGMLLGLDIDTAYYEEQVQLQPGDTVLYYTDGITDAANARGERFDEDNLINALKWACRNCPSAEAILGYLFEMLGRFVGSDRPPEDDVTVVVMRVKPELQLNLFQNRP